jgi:hypothetical protein
MLHLSSCTNKYMASVELANSTHWEARALQTAKQAGNVLCKHPHDIRSCKGYWCIAYHAWQGRLVEHKQYIIAVLTDSRIPGSCR